MLKAIVQPVTPFEQNASILYCSETKKCAGARRNEALLLKKFLELVTVPWDTGMLIFAAANTFFRSYISKQDKRETRIQFDNS